MGNSPGYVKVKWFQVLEFETIFKWFLEGEERLHIFLMDLLCRVELSFVSTHFPYVMI